MSEAIKHAKVITTTQLDPETEMIQTDSHYEQLANTKQEIERIKVHPVAELQTVLESAVGQVAEGCPRLQITIEPSKWPGTFKVTKRWTVSSESFHRKGNRE